MEQQLIWKVLGIEPTKEETVLKNRYHELLREVNPEDDPEGFKRLREAYEHALALAKQPEETSEGEQQPKDEIDVWLDKVNDIYWYIDTRNNPELWEKLFDDPVCVALDTALEVRERFLVFLMSHVYIDQTIWKAIDKEFNIIADKQELCEMFPRDFLDYVQYQIENQNFLTYELFEITGLDESEIQLDTYISAYLKIKAQIDRKEIDNQRQQLDDLKAYEVYHPYEDVERVRLFMHEKQAEQALALCEQLLEKYPEDAYVGYWSGRAYWEAEQWEAAYNCWQRVMDNLPEHYTARIGIAQYYMKVGKNLEAKEIIMDLLEINGRDESLLDLMREVNIPLIEHFRKQMEQEPEEKKHVIELCWCMFQNEMFEETLQELSRLELVPEDAEYYDYVNMKSRCYLGLEQYEKAIEYLHEWNESRLRLVDDGSEKYKKRQAREGFIKCAIGVTYQHLKQNDLAEEYLLKGISLEKDSSIRYSFMDRLALLYYKMKEYKKCIDVCSQIIEEEPGYFPAYLRRQDAYFELQDGQNVVNDYYNAIHIYPKYYKPYLLAVKVFCIYRQYGDAKKVLEAAKEQGVEHEMLDFYEIRVLRNLAQSIEERQKGLYLCRELKKQILATREEKIEAEQPDESSMTEEELLNQDMRKDGIPEDKVDIQELDVELILFFVDMKDEDRALELIDQGIQSGNTNYRLHWIKADILRKRNNFIKAMEEYDFLVREMPYNGEFLYGRAICLEKMGKNDEAIEAFRKTLEVEPRHALANHEIMKIYSQRFDDYELRSAYGAALKAVNAQVEIVPDAYYYIERGLLYMDNYNMNLALADYNKALELEPNNLFAYNNIGYVYRVQGKYQEAIECFRKAIELMDDEKSMLPFTNMAKCYEALGEPEQGIEVLFEAKRKYKISNSWYRCLGELYECIGNFEAARKLYEEAIEDDRLSRHDYYFKISKTYLLEGNYREALSVYKSWLDNTRKGKEGLGYTWKNRIEVLEEMGNYYFWTRDLKQAVKYYEQVIQIAERNNLTFDSCGRSLARLYYLLGHKDKARIMAQKAMQSELKEKQIPEEYKKLETEDPESEAYYLSFRPYAAMRLEHFAELYFCMGDEARALQYLDQVGRIPRCKHCSFKECYEVLIARGFIAEAKGDIAGAIRYYEQARQVFPADREIALLLRVLKNKQ
ncbi:MAG: tetratricopeptide repeat protein [Lachnospiraceae bacterium]|nr:tetratricopeptide repeat protein [Lachnospiraceae bacterium]